MPPRPLMLLLLLAGCSKGPEADLQYISQARSLAAEWALVNEQASEGRVTDTYTRTMRQSVREDLQTTASTLGHPDSRYGEQIRPCSPNPTMRRRKSCAFMPIA